MNLNVIGDLLKLIESCLADRNQRYVLIEKNFKYKKIKTGVPQGSV